MNRLIVLSGVPGSGKSYFTKLLKKKKKTHLYIISSDQLRASILHNQRDLSKDALIWEVYYGLVRAYGVDKDAIVVLDSTHAKKMYRLGRLKEFRTAYREIDLICFQLDKETILKQNKERKYPIPEEALLKLINEYEMPDTQEQAFFDHIDIVKDHDVDKILKRYL